MKQVKGNNKYVWLDTADYVNEMSIVAQFLYYIGVIKQKRYTNKKGKPKQMHSGGFYRSLFGFRWWHPISIIIVLVAFVVTFCCFVVGCIAQAFKIAVCDFNKFEISVGKPLMKNKEYVEETDKA